MSYHLERFQTWQFWKDLFSIKYWRHRESVVKETNRLMDEEGWGFTQARIMAWAKELREEAKEGLDEIG